MDEIGDGNMSEKEEKELKWPNKLYMLQENEIWLNEKVKEGLFLKSFVDDYVMFVKGKPEDIKYKIVILNPKNAKNQIKIIEHQGFTFVAEYKEYYIFYIKGRYGHFQPRLNEDTIEFARKWFNKQIINGFTLAIVASFPALLNLIAIISFNELFQTLVGRQTIWYAMWLIMFVFLMIKGISEYKIVIKCRRCFLEHERYVKKNNSILTKVINRSSLVFIMVVVILGAYMIYNDNLDDKLPLSKAYNDMPFVFLQDIEKQEALVGENKEVLNYLDKNNYAKIESTLLAPKQYFAEQEYDMSIHYYEVVVRALAKPLARELITEDIFDIKMDDIKKINYDGLDIVYICQDGYKKSVSVCKGKRVMFIEYHGVQPVERILSEMAEVL